MSSDLDDLTALVPVLDGTNYHHWTNMMKAFLMYQGLWRSVIEENASTTASVAVRNEITATEADTIHRQGFTSPRGEQDNYKALAFIRYRLSASICTKFLDIESAADLWSGIKRQYGKPSLAAVLSEYIAIKDLAIPNTEHPVKALDEFDAYSYRLASMDFPLPESFLPMLLLSKIFDSYPDVARRFLSMNDIGALSIQAIRHATTNALEWQNATLGRQQAQPTLSKRKHGRTTLKGQQPSDSASGNGLQ